MTAEKIMNVALRHFARNGYERASLADIATEVGIKKTSIYNHFKGKDDLFMAVFENAAKRELHFVQAYLKPYHDVQLEQQLFGFLSGYKERYMLNFRNEKSSDGYCLCNMDRYWYCRGRFSWHVFLR